MLDYREILSSTPEKTGRSTLAAKELLAPEVISELIHKVGHEIGNPLTSVISFATIIQRVVEESDPTAGTLPRGWEKLDFYATSVIDEAWRVTHLTQRLVLLLSQRNPERSPLDVERVIQRAASRLRRQSRCPNFTLRIEGDVNAQAIHSSAEHLEMLFAELLQNAVYAFEEISKSGAPSGAGWEIPVVLQETPTSLKVALINPIQSATEGSLVDLFRPFVSKKQRVGLGLTAVACIAERIGAQVELRETEQGGLRHFVSEIELPRDGSPRVESSESAPASSWTPEISTAALPAKLSVLLIDDDAAVSSAIRKVMEVIFPTTTQVTVATAQGLDALQILQRGQKFDILLCDLELKDTSGQDIFRQVTAQWPTLQKRFVFMTGRKGDMSLEMFFVTSGCPVLYKPFEPEELVEVILKLVTS